MGAVGGMLGLNGGASGSGFDAPSRANIQNPISQDQINTAVGGNNAAMASQQNLLQALQGQNGLQNQNQVYGQLQGVVNGTGPNPAQAMLNQSTGQNVANQSALMAGQRGAGANVGLMARQAAQQGAATQQQAAGQGATLQANQSLNALNSAGALANTQAGNQINQTNTNQAATMGNVNALLGNNNAYNNSMVQSQSNINSANAGLANTSMGNQASAIGGLSGGAAGSGALGSNLQSYAMAAEGGEIKSPFHRYLMARGGTVPALVSPGEVYLSPEKVQEVKGGANPMKVGEKIQGKPAVGGAKNSYANDTVKKNLDEGGIIVPRSETKSKNPDRKSSDFVAKVLARKK